MDTATHVKPRACIIDRDGTLARIDRTFVEGDRPDWASFNAAIPFDTPVPAIVSLTQCVSPEVAVIVTTGRSIEFRGTMRNWLDKHEVRYDFLLMRAAKDQRSDDKVKLDIYCNNIEPFFDVQFVVDDRPSVVSMWESIGLPVIAVQQPEHILPVFAGLGSTEMLG